MDINNREPGQFAGLGQSGALPRRGFLRLAATGAGVVAAGAAGLSLGSVLSACTEQIPGAGGNGRDFFRRKAVPVVARFRYQKNARRGREDAGGFEQRLVRNIEYIGTAFRRHVGDGRNIGKPRLDKALFDRRQALGKSGHVAVCYRANTVVYQKLNKITFA